MRFWWNAGVGSLAAMALIAVCPATGETKPPAAGPLAMSVIIQQYEADARSLERTYSLDLSDSHMQRFTKFYADELAELDALDFSHLSHDDQVDYLLLRNLLTSKQHQLAIRQRQIAEMAPLLPFEKKIEALIDAKRLMQKPDGEKSAAALVEITRQIDAARKQFDPGPHGGVKAEGAKPKIDPVVANRAVQATGQLSAEMHEWFSQYNSYDPEFTWWVDKPFQETDKALKGYSDFLKEKLVGIAPEDKT